MTNPSALFHGIFFLINSLLRHINMELLAYYKKQMGLTFKQHFLYTAFIMIRNRNNFLHKYIKLISYTKRSIHLCLAKTKFTATKPRCPPTCFLFSNGNYIKDIHMNPFTQKKRNKRVKRNHTQNTVSQVPLCTSQPWTVEPLRS